MRFILGIALLLLPFSVQAEVYKDAGGNIIFKVAPGYNIEFRTDRSAYANGQFIGKCPLGLITKVGNAYGTLKCAGTAVKVIDADGNQLKIVGDIVKGIRANGSSEALMEGGTIVAVPGAVVAPGMIAAPGAMITPGRIETPGAVITSGGIATHSYNYDQVVTDLGAKRVGNNMVLDLSNDVLFDFGKADITPAASEKLSKLAFLIQQDRKGKVLIQGHTDAVGSNEANLKLSLARANSVSGWLQRNASLDPSVVQINGLGEDFPVAANTHPDGTDNPQGRSLNRRVAVLIQTVDEPLKVQGAVDSVIVTGNRAAWNGGSVVTTPGATTVYDHGDSVVVHPGGMVAHDAEGDDVVSGPGGMVIHDNEGERVVILPDGSVGVNE